MWEAYSRGWKCGRIIETTNLLSCKIIRPSLVHSVSWDPMNSLCHAEGQQAPCRSLGGAFTSHQLDLDMSTGENLICGIVSLGLPNLATSCCHVQCSVPTKAGLWQLCCPCPGSQWCHTWQGQYRTQQGAKENCQGSGEPLLQWDCSLTSQGMEECWDVSAVSCVSYLPIFSSLFTFMCIYINKRVWVHLQRRLDGSIARDGRARASFA